MQKKDVIYIDVEDDITAIIGKVKASKEKIIALVPPKRIGVLQSLVNLRLLARTADKADKRLVIITGNAAMAGLAAGAKIPVAKTLTSRPEIAEISALSVDDEDVIDGGELPVGDHAKLHHKDSDAEKAVDDIDIDGEPAPKKPHKLEKTSAKKRISVPDFGSFRRKLALLSVGGVGLIAFLVWAIAIAPHATVVLSARTSDVQIDTPVTLASDSQTDVTKKTLPSVTESETKSDSVDFVPTGTKDVGDKASGTVEFSNCSTDGQPKTIPAGTYLNYGTYNYIVQATVVVPKAVFPGTGCGNGILGPGVSADVQVVAENAGDQYNTSPGASFEVAGFTSDMTASSSGGITGGSSKTVTVVSAQDVQKAESQLTQDNSDTIKKDLQGKFDSGTTVIDDSFTANTGKQTITPDIGEEVTDGKATLAVQITYSMTGVANAALDDFLNGAITQQLGNVDSKRIYDSGARSASLTDFTLSKDKKSATLQLSATGKVGPKIDDNNIKNIVKGKRYGDIQNDLKAIDGVSDVHLDLSPFWVFSVPNDPNKITIEFKLLKNNG